MAYETGKLAVRGRDVALAGKILGNRLATLLAIVVLNGIWLSSPAAAQTKTFCSEPVTPFCANRAGVFEDDMARERCRDDVEKYATDMTDFISCLSTQQDEAKDRAALIEERFACMAEGNEDCP